MGTTKKAEDLLPGEEVVTPTGQKIKVWSTKGPVEVDRAPEPFEDREKTVIDGAHIVVDHNRLRRNGKDHGGRGSKQDSFAIPAQPKAPR